MRRRLFGPGGDNGGAVAPTVALSLIALIAVGGIAFDYARLVSMDTELQNAADQAALAAASQLDKKTDACERAVAAARGLVDNQTRFANDNGGLAIAIGLPTATAAQLAGCNGDATITYNAANPIRLYQDKSKTPATSDANARFVEVTVNSRQARYALTPIAAAFQSGAIAATAFAGLGSAICKIPPLMMCNPSPGTPFDPDAWRGKGIKIFEGGGGSWAPGAFGWLDVGAVSNGTPDQRIAVAMDNPNTNCVADEGVEVDTGASVSVLDALNIRFDIFANGWARNTCHPHAGCSPAANTTKDVVRAGLPANVNACGIHQNEWDTPSEGDMYIAQDASGNDATVVHMGYPMDICHYPLGGSCGTANPRFGNGSWRRDIYFKTNHASMSDSTGSNWQAATGLSANASRYDIYRWEQNISGVGNGNGSRPEFTAGGKTQYGRPVCKPPGLSPGANQPDRRVMAVAVADNCSELNGGSSAVDVGAWAEIFLVQPSVDRPAATGVDASDIYIEIIGRANPTGSGAVAQVVHRDVPYLIE